MTGWIGLFLAALAGCGSVSSTSRAPVPSTGSRVDGATRVVWAEGEDAVRRVPLEIVPIAGGRGRVGSGEGWTVRLMYGPADHAGCLEMPGHVQVKLGAEPILRQNTWLRVDEIQLFTTGSVAWLLLASPRRAEMIELGGERRRVTWDHDGVGPCGAVR